MVLKQQGYLPREDNVGKLIIVDLGRLLTVTDDGLALPAAKPTVRRPKLRDKASLGLARPAALA